MGFTVSGSSAAAVNALNDYAGVQTPNIFTNTFGGIGSNNSVLALAMDQANDTRFVTNRIDFTYAHDVRNVSFTMFDIDQGSYQDQITVTAWLNGTQLAANLVTVTAHNATYTSVTGTNVARGINGSVADTGANSGLGNVTFQIDANTIIESNRYSIWQRSDCR